MSETPKPANVLVSAVGMGVTLVYLRGGFDKAGWGDIFLALAGAGTIGLIAWYLAGLLIRLGRWLRMNRNL